jgi:hypothetical protein
MGGSWPVRGPRRITSGMMAPLSLPFSKCHYLRIERLVNSISEIAGTLSELSRRKINT